MRVPIVKSATKFLSVAAALLYATLVVVNNRWDWDHFYASFSVDISSWLVDHTPPLWSYQLCGGMPKAADPQSFGLSPLFVFHLLFGPIWGTKVLLLVLYGIGYYYLSRTFALILKQNPDDSAEVLALGLPMTLLLGGYFCWQIVAGHFTFMLMLLVVALLYYSLKAAVQGLSFREKLAALLLGWAYFSGGIYHSFVFLWLPITLSFSLVLGFSLIGGLLRHRWREPWQRCLRFAGAHGLMILPGLYKLIPVYLNQLHNPRGGMDLCDLHVSLAKVLIFQFFPTIGPQISVFRSIVTIHGDYPWIIWELGSFSTIGWVLALTLGISLFAARKWAGVDQPIPANRLIGLMAATTVAFSLLLALGNFHPLSPYTLLNKYLFQNSARISYRFGFSISYSLALLLVWLLAQRRRLQRRIARFILLPAVVVSCCCVYPFLNTYGIGKEAYPPGRYWENGDVPLTGHRMKDALTFPTLSLPSTRQMTEFVIHRDITWPPMMTHLRRGRGYLDCYNPLVFGRQMQSYIDQVHDRLKTSPDQYVFEVVPLIANGSERCRQESYFTQARLYISPACEVGTCLNVNGINPADPIKDYLSVEQGRFCLTKPLPGDY